MGDVGEGFFGYEKLSNDGGRYTTSLVAHPTLAAVGFGNY
jgi:hypothetical protein